jgi:hypothetical protein
MVSTFLSLTDAIPYNFPDMPVRVAEVAGIAAIECVLRRLDDLGAGAPRLLDRLVDLFPARHIVADRERRRTVPGLRQARIVGDVVLRPDRELQSSREVEEGHGAVLEFAADDAFCRQAETIAVKCQRPLQVGDGQRQHGYARFHRGSPMRC